MWQPLAALLRHIALREWLVLTALVSLLAGLLGSFCGLGRIDQTIYDRLLQSQSRPARPDIVIIAIDDYSLAQLGRWPWPRATHAQLLERLQAAAPKAIGLDVIFTEPERQVGAQVGGDFSLAGNLAANRRTVLPIALQSAGSGLAAAAPIPVLTDSARALAHINLDLDSDGVVRRVFLYEGQQQWWPQFALGLKEIGDSNGNTPLPPVTSPKLATRANTWQRSNPLNIRYYGGNGHFQSIPYVSVLRGEVDSKLFDNKYVLIGATAEGLTDQYPTPMAGNGSMSGIEIHANILANLLDGTSVRPANQTQTVLFSVVPALLAMLAYLLVSPRISLLVNVTLFVATGLFCYVLLTQGVWLPPAAAWIALLLSYPLWSWRRLEAAIDYLAQEFRRLDREPHILPEVAEPASPQAIQDLLGNRIDAVERAARRVRDLRQFISDSLDSLPDATLVCTIDGHVLLANRIALAYFSSIGKPSAQDALLPYLFADMKSPQPLDQAGQTAFNWWDLLDPEKASNYPNGIEVSDALGRDLLIKSAACYTSARELSGWIVSISDISVIRSAERSREETLRFISHDMRGPQASILALLELQRDPDSAMPLADLFSRIEKASRNTLDLADNFVQLARAESQEYRLVELDMQVALYDAIDDVWAQAHAKRITVDAQVPDEEFLVNADRALITRALINLLSNAIKYSTEGTAITCQIERRASITHSDIVCSVRDQGVGIAAGDQAKLFRRFQRIHNPGHARQDGIGLGLVFVKAVVERHNGRIEFQSRIGEGTTFRILLPALPNL